jgi:hypothetical protein
LLAETLSYQSLFEVVVRQGHSRSPLLQAFLEDLHAGHAKRLLDVRGAKRAMRGGRRGRARPAP